MASTNTTTPPASPSQPESHHQFSPPDHNRSRSHSSLSTSASSPIPPPIPVETHPNRAAGFKPLPIHQHSHTHSHSHSHSHPHAHGHSHSRSHVHAQAHAHTSHLPDPTRLAPEDAYYAAAHSHAPHPRLRPPLPGHAHTHTHVTNHAASLRVPGSPASVAAVAALRPPPAVPGTDAGKLGVKEHWGGRTRRRRKRKRVWKKLLWVKQSCKLISKARERKEQGWVADFWWDGSPRQLYRHGDVPGPFAAKSSSATVRLLALGCGFYGNCAACLLRCDIRVLLHGDFPGARQSRVSRELRESVYDSGLGILGLLGREGA